VKSVATAFREACDGYRSLVMALGQVGYDVCHEQVRPGTESPMCDEPAVCIAVESEEDSQWESYCYEHIPEIAKTTGGWCVMYVAPDEDHMYDPADHVSPADGCSCRWSPSGALHAGSRLTCTVHRP